MLDPVTLYSKDGQSRRIPAIDAPGWIAAGWELEPPSTPTPQEVDPPPETDKTTTRRVKNAGNTIPES